MGSGAGDWAAAYVKARAFVAQLSDDEKVNLTAGVTSNTGCSGYIQAIDRLGFPGMCVSDAGNGLVSNSPSITALFVFSQLSNFHGLIGYSQRGTDYVNSWASGISVGARYVLRLI